MDDLQVSYVSMGINEPIDTISSRNMFDRFKWFNVLVSISPMWSTRDSTQQKRSKLCNLIGIVHVILLSGFTMGFLYYYG